MSLSEPRILGVIPARYASTRLPGKPLADIAGKPMIVRVWEQAKCAQSLDEVVVATDDARIAEAVNRHGGEAIMTPEDLASGTDRVAWVVGQGPADIVVNIQGDEPFLDPAAIDAAVALLTGDELAVMGTLVRKLTDLRDLQNPNAVKVALDRSGNALYFSRSAIPFQRDEEQAVFYQHVGLYVYRKKFLLQYSQMDQSPLEKTEKLEQLRALENGYQIKTAEIFTTPLCVDTPEDLERARAMAVKTSP